MSEYQDKTAVAVLDEKLHPDHDPSVINEILIK